eukprot:TRINITY_DN9566_c0_g2_i3.p1 TRINITY_DN9566_c0_g2~~TRINITY_DN9566_c0_g2_i3.p1  ORF type:complete len:332 (+),score=2.38 TRINITY_DN9566_c0_g2_i3:37-996(+)
MDKASLAMDASSKLYVSPDVKRLAVAKVYRRHWDLHSAELGEWLSLHGRRQRQLVAEMHQLRKLLSNAPEQHKSTPATHMRDLVGQLERLWESRPQFRFDTRNVSLDELLRVAYAELRSRRAEAVRRSVAALDDSVPMPTALSSTGHEPVRKLGSSRADTRRRPSNTQSPPQPLRRPSLSVPGVQRRASLTAEARRSSQTGAPSRRSSLRSGPRRSVESAKDAAGSPPTPPPQPHLQSSQRRASLRQSLGNSDLLPPLPVSRGIPNSSSRRGTESLAQVDASKNLPHTSRPQRTSVPALPDISQATRARSASPPRGQKL